MTTTRRKLVADVMTPSTVSVDPGAVVTEAAIAMRDEHIGDVMVMDGPRLVGVLTDRDIAVRVLANRLDPSSTRVADVCSPSIVSVGPDAAVDTAIMLMRQEAVRRLPVIDTDGVCHGILSIGDLAMAQEPDSVLGEISTAPPNS